MHPIANHINITEAIFKKRLCRKPKHTGEILIFGFMCYTEKEFAGGQLPLWKIFLDCTRLYYILGIHPYQLDLTQYETFADCSIRDLKFKEAFEFYNYEYGLDLSTDILSRLKFSWLAHEFLHLFTGAPKSFEGDYFISSLSRFLVLDKSLTHVHPFWIWEDFRFVGSYYRMMSHKGKYPGNLYDHYIFQSKFNKEILGYVHDSVALIESGYIIDFNSILEMRQYFQISFEDISALVDSHS